MDLFWLAITGLVAGAIAKALMPGEKAEPRGCLLTMLLGIGGSVLFGALTAWLFGWEAGGNLIGRIVAGVVGAMIIVALLRRFAK